MFQVSSGDSTVIVLFVIHRFFGIEVGKGMHPNDTDLFTLQLVDLVQWLVRRYLGDTIW